MKNFLINTLLPKIIFILTVMVTVKIVWFTISLLYLPTSGVEHMKVTKPKSLYYRVKLATKSKQAPVKVVKKPKKPPVEVSMKGIKLLGIYNSKDVIVVTVSKGRETTVLSRGEEIDGFVLKSAGSDYAVFEKSGKEFTLKMEEIKTQNNHSSITIDKSVPTKKRREEKRESKEIVTSEDGDSKIVSKGLLTSYTQDINKIWRDIGIGEHQTDGVIDGFKVNFVKKGSDFEKLGLKSGDILRSINGEELNSYGTAYNFYRGIENVDSLTIGITRDNHDMELEYEIH